MKTSTTDWPWSRFACLLREPRGDIPALAEGYLRRTAPNRAWHLSLSLRRVLTASENLWPGNIRQLERTIGRARDRAHTRDPSVDTLGPEHLHPDDVERLAARVTPAASTRDVAVGDADVREAYRRVQDERARVDALEQRVLQEAVDKHGGVVAHAARALGVARSTLISRMEALGVTRPGRGDKP